MVWDGYKQGVGDALRERVDNDDRRSDLDVERSVCGGGVCGGGLLSGAVSMDRTWG
jgi:hypothetical protein